jgi:hypothetical protein
MRRSATKQVSESAHIEATTPSNAADAYALDSVLMAESA